MNYLTGQQQRMEWLDAHRAFKMALFAQGIDAVLAFILYGALSLPDGTYARNIEAA